MHYSYTLIALAVSAVSTLAAPVLEKRQSTVLIVTDIVTVTTTQTLTDLGPAPTDPFSDDFFGGTFPFFNFPGFGPSSAATLTVTVQPDPVTVRPNPVISAAPETAAPETAAPVTTASPLATSSVSEQAPVASPTGGAFEMEILAAHNSRRAMHSAPPLTYNSTMSAFALTVVSSCMFQHSGGPYGENLAAGYATPTDAIQAWYAEGANYDYAAAMFSEATGHFTQVVWVAASMVGCAQATCNGENGTPGTFLACEYDTGNVIGEFRQNVLPPVAGAAVASTAAASTAAASSTAAAAAPTAAASSAAAASTAAAAASTAAAVASSSAAVASSSASAASTAAAAASSSAAAA